MLSRRIEDISCDQAGVPLRVRTCVAGCIVAARGRCAMAEFGAAWEWVLCEFVGGGDGCSLSYVVGASGRSAGLSVFVFWGFLIDRCKYFSGVLELLWRLSGRRDPAGSHVCWL